jgi:hypothetical protein
MPANRGEMKMRSTNILVALLLSLSACAPGATDVTYPILGGYIFSDAGGPEKTVLYEGDATVNGIVVDARVDKYRVSGTKIFVARRPRLVTNINGTMESSLSQTCEHWVIDTVTHTIVRIDDKVTDAQLPCMPPDNLQFNPRL